MTTVTGIEAPQDQAAARLAGVIGQVIGKLADGTYQTEPVRCFCGADFDDLVLAERDRYFIPHRTVLCRQCSLIRTTPRMTAAAYREFYNIEYRPIYDGWQFGTQGDNDEFRFMVQSEKGLSFKQFLEFFELRPKTVVDVGANMGGTLAAFQESGCTVYGIEWYEQGFTFGEHCGIPMLHSVEEALARGIKADLVILQDVFEHYLDLREIAKIKQLLAPDGVLFVGTPGIFNAKRHLLWQNAHTYTFVGETLRYVLCSLGFEEMFLDENIDSLWVAHDEPIEIAKPAEWGRYIIEHLEQREPRSVPPLRGVNKFPVGDRWRHMECNLARGLPDIREIQSCQGEAIIVGAGPSANTELDRLRALQANGASVIAIDRMYPFCARAGLIPQFVLALDSSDDVLEGFTDIQPETCHLLASTVHPSVFDALEGRTIYIFNSLNPHMKTQNLWHRFGYRQVRVINTGASVTLGAFVIAMTLGFRRFHFIGFDLKVGEREYADGVAGQGVTRQYFTAEVGDKQVLTCISFLSFAQQFFRLVSDGRRAGLIESIDVHGDSLINDMWDKGVNAWPTSSPAIPSS